ncbi:MAG: hypothetical protein WCQ62_01980 [Sphaerochaeta sp.]|jgi:hypothetical protein
MVKQKQVYFGIYDVFGTRMFHCFGSNDENEPGLHFIKEMSPLLVSPDARSCNRSPYLMNRKRLFLDDVLTGFAGTGFQFDFNIVKSLDRMLMGLDHTIEMKEDGAGFMVSPSLGSFDRGHLNNLRSWFGLTASEMTEACREKGIGKVESYVVPIPDSLSVDGQDRLLTAAQNIGNRVLLWRSVAACIGCEQIFSDAGLRDGDIVMVIDHHAVGLVVSNITMHEYEGRLIPGHRIYFDSDKNSRNIKNFPVERNCSYYSNLGDAFPYNVSDGSLSPCQWRATSTSWREVVEAAPRTRLIIAMGDMTGISYGVGKIPVHEDVSGSSVCKGAALFADRQRRGIVSYFDECESLSLVVFTKEEEIVFKTLIEGTDRLKNGFVENGKKVTGVKLPKTASDIQALVKFYLRLGDPDKNKPLKLLEQEFSVSKEYVDNPYDINLVLTPTMTAGQGRAKVYVDVADNKDSSVFGAVNLDWEKMEEATTTISGKKVPETINTLEMGLSRSFPVRVPPVRSDWNRFISVRGQIRSYVDGNIPIDHIKLDRTMRPNPKALGVERFQRVNAYGSEKSGNGISGGSSDIALSERFFRKLNQEALENWKTKEGTFCLTVIGWTYHGGYFPKVIQKVLDDIEFAAKHGGSTLQQNMTICANLLEDEKELVRFLKAFFLRLKNKEGLNHWLRGAYQVLMYHTSFLCCGEFSSTEFYDCVDDLTNLFFSSYDHEQIQGNVVRVLIFLLKFRRYDSDFCREDSSDDRSVRAFRKMKFVAKTPSCTGIGFLQDMLNDFLEGQGSLDLPFD